MGTPFTHTTWQVKAGHEEEFVARWREWAEWSHRQGLRAHARLLRDVEHPGTFVSFGPWETIAAVRTWRGEAGYHERVARLQELVEHFEPRTLEQVAEIYTPRPLPSLAWRSKRLRGPGSSRARSSPTWR